MYLSRDQLLRRMERREQDVPLPGGHIARIRELTLRDRVDANEAGKPDPVTFMFTDQASFHATVVQRGVIDSPGGQLVFQPEDVPALAAARDFEYETSDMRILANAIWSLSEADPDSFRDAGAADAPAEHDDHDDSGADADGDGHTGGADEQRRRKRGAAHERVASGV